MNKKADRQIYTIALACCDIKCIHIIEGTSTSAKGATRGAIATVCEEYGLDRDEIFPLAVKLGSHTESIFDVLGFDDELMVDTKKQLH